MRIFPSQMQHTAGGNYLKAHRREAGLSLRELGDLIGKGSGQVSRHERSMSVPPLAAAFAYELIFRVPVSAIFIEMHDAVRDEIEGKLRQMEEELGNRDALGRDAKLVAQKLVWLNERRSR
jgi:transcriptional regulator with XRE-family HTH domain